MKWLTHDEAHAAARNLLNSRCQMIVLAAEIEALLQDAPTQPKILGPEQGAPSLTWQWHGQIGTRVLALEAPVDASLTKLVTVYTHFLPAQDTAGDWAVLVELQGLPRSVYPTRPTFVESRAVDPACVVYRAAPAGWNAPIYLARSAGEAAELLTFLKRDPWNQTSFVGDPEPIGKWATIQEGEVFLGTGGGLNSVLRFACEMSSRYPSITYKVEDISKRNREVYAVANGRVLPGLL